MAKTIKAQAKSHKSRKTQGKFSAADAPPSSALATRQSSFSPPLSSTGEAGADAPVDPDHMIGPPAAELPQNQYWYRPPDSKARKYFEKIVVLRAAGHHDEEIAKRLKTTAASVRQYVYLAKRNGWADDEGEPIDLEAELALNIDRKVVRNINHTLDGGMTNWQTHEMTIAAAKGRGVFKSDKADASVNVTMPIVAIRIDMPALSAAHQVVNEANVGGTPNYQEAEIIEPAQLTEGASGEAKN
jgi:transposase